MDTTLAKCHIKVTRQLIHGLGYEYPQLTNAINRVLDIVQSQNEKIETLENEIVELSRKKLDDPNYDNDY
jgi:hypothetical protein